MQQVIFTPSDFVAILNQALEQSYAAITIEGELVNFKVSKNKWLYFSLKDEIASVAFFGSIYQLPGPLEDGLMIRAVGTPRLHPRFGFTINLQSIIPVGEGSLKKAADLLFKKLEAEGLFLPERKRPLPFAPKTIGLITASSSAAYADFVKILNDRWGGVEVLHVNVHVQGDLAPAELETALSHFNQLGPAPEVIVMTRGGGSAEDLAAFNDERIVRAVASSRIPTLVAIGHENDISLAELAADQRASTPSNAVQMLVPDKKTELSNLKSRREYLRATLGQSLKQYSTSLMAARSDLRRAVLLRFTAEIDRIKTTTKMLELFNPETALKRGYALIRKGGHYISSVKQTVPGDQLSISLNDGTILAKAQRIRTKADDRA